MIGIGSIPAEVVDGRGSSSSLFLAPSKHGSFRKATLALGTYESSVSRRVRDIEGDLGASLFQRHRRGRQRCALRSLGTEQGPTGRH
ncbi:LysR family transcriptional regulator [Bosea sp. F3-2]|uniref:helix-turn-helix domain-containing protein n=1 Tax=Bosea sp. F3-2 TaxID=2599640 RepID=UPI0020C117FD|nr:LysR family transcriptional regulator [Bosea sp. F3-2]